MKQFRPQKLTCFGNVNSMATLSSFENWGLPTKLLISSLQCYSVLSDILVKNELCIPLKRGSNVLSTGEGCIAYLLPVSLKSLCFSVLSTK